MSAATGRQTNPLHPSAFRLHPLAEARFPLARAYQPSLLLILLLATAVRVIALGASELWLDEGISYFVAKKPPLELIAYTAASAWEHPPGYYLLLHYWMALVGNSEFGLRYLSVLGGLLSVALAAGLARRWFGPAAGILAGLLMAVQPMAVHAARDARTYAWLFALALLATLLLDRAFIRNRWLDWGRFLLVVLACSLLHYLAGLFLVALVIFLALFWRRLPASRWRLVLALVIVLAAGLAWVAIQSGPRDTLLGTLTSREESGQFIASLEPVYRLWALSDVAFDLPQPVGWLLAALPWLLALVGAIGMGGIRWWGRADLRWLILLLVLIPPLLLALVFPLPSARHSAAMLGVYVVSMAFGVTLVWRRSPALGVAALVALVGLDLAMVGLAQRQASRPFSDALTYISSRAGDGEPIVYAHPYAWPQNDYYNRRGLPAYYIPENNAPVTDEEANTRAAALLADSSSLWLYLYPSLLEPERVQAAFDRLAFPTEKKWFPGESAVVHYFAARALEAQEGGMVWADRIRLNRWWVSDTTLRAGDALRLQFEWQADGPAPEQSLIALSLVGPDGNVWASRLGEPCNDRCPVADWTDSPVTDRQALEVPADVPPGDYEVRISWLSPSGEPALVRASATQVAQTSLHLMDLRVDPPAPSAQSAPLARPFGIPFGPGLVLRSTDFTGGTTRGAASLAVPLQWEVTGPLPELQARLTLTSRDSLTLEAPLGPAWYSSETWTPRTVRVLPRFNVPGTITPATYQATLTVVEADTGLERGQVNLGSLTVQDRQRSFDLPAAGTAIDASWAEDVQLVQFTAPAHATAGAAISVTLVWRAAGPTTRDWKVFVHLVGPDGAVKAQGDAYPAAGAARVHLAGRRDRGGQPSHRAAGRSSIGRVPLPCGLL